MSNTQPKNERPPVYKNDAGWSLERQKKSYDIYDGLQNKSLTNEEALEEISALIKEVDSAIMQSPGEPGTTRYSTSPFLQGLFASFYYISRDGKD